MLGGFGVQTLRQYKKLIDEGDVVLDIGANVGSLTLPLAKLVGVTGKIFAFEPTAYAFEKQQTNIALNPVLISRISTHQIMLTATDSDSLPEAIYSSWPLETAADLHGVHHGRLMDTKGCLTSSLETFVLGANIERIDVIKPELAPHIYDSSPYKFDQLLAGLCLWDIRYVNWEISSSGFRPQFGRLSRRLVP